MSNDGASGKTPDRYSFGLRGLSERLTEVGGTLRHHRDGDVFHLDVQMRSAG